MSVQTRALIIGMTGPAIQAIGIVWEVAHILAYHLNAPLSARHIAFEPGFLLVFVGFLLALVCVPAAIEVARATPAEVEIPVFKPAETDSGRPDGESPRWLRGIE
jgi:hypothetical protein